jgi:hypothetical protein
MVVEFKKLPLLHAKIMQIQVLIELCHISGYLARWRQKQAGENWVSKTTDLEKNYQHSL